MSDLKDRRKTQNKIDEDERQKLIARCVYLRDEVKWSWANIAHDLDIASPATVRSLYAESGRDPHHLLEGKGGRTRKFESGDWCDSRCIGALPDSPCDCKCDGENHSGGPSHAEVILKKQGKSPEQVMEQVGHVADIQEENERKATLSGDDEEV